MGSIQPKAKGRGGKKAGWRALYRDNENKQRSKSFDRKADAQRFLATVEADKLRGTYVDPRAGKITLNEYAETFMAAQVWREGTRATAQSHIDNHIGPALGNRQLATITRTDVQAFVASLTAKGLAPTTVAGIHVRLVSILEAAVHDGRIVRSPAVKIRLPTVIKTAASQVVALDLDDVRRIADAAPPHLTAFVWLIATAGLRPGEAAGLTVERVELPTKDHRRGPATINTTEGATASRPDQDHRQCANRPDQRLVACRTQPAHARRIRRWRSNPAPHLFSPTAQAGHCGETRSGSRGANYEPT